MDHNCTTCEKKLVSKARSCNGPPLRLRGERPLSGAGGREAVRSLDLALGRVKRPRLSPAPYSAAGARPISVRRGNTITDMFTDSKNISPSGMDNASLMSMNFSHYELMRNLSRSNCNSEGAAVSSSVSTFGPVERSMKDEHLERYFRSVEMWSRRCRDGPSNIRFNIPEN